MMHDAGCCTRLEAHDCLEVEGIGLVSLKLEKEHKQGGCTSAGRPLEVL